MWNLFTGVLLMLAYVACGALSTLVDKSISLWGWITGKDAD